MKLKLRQYLVTKKTEPEKKIQSDDVIITVIIAQRIVREQQNFVKFLNRTSAIGTNFKF